MAMDTLRAFFMWAALINIILLFASTIICAFFLGPIHRLHSLFFPMSKETFSIVIYSLIGFYKILVVSLLVVPYLALLIIS